jgi:hypothetical protein
MLLAVLLCGLPVLAQAWEKGIYLSQNTAEDSKRLSYFIEEAKATGINTFIIDLIKPRPAYDKNIAMVQANNIKYIPRIVVFPHGANDEQMKSMSIREDRYRLIEHAVALGAKEIQLDYIRYNTKRAPLPEYTQNVHDTIKWFRDKLKVKNVGLQIDVFGETCFYPSKHIGQDVTVLAKTVDALNPMVYPSHFNPVAKFSKNPYETIYSSMVSLHKQFNNHTPVRVHAYIEMTNYRMPLSREKTKKYIYAQIKGAEDGGSQGWYAWSPGNKYDNLFEVLKTTKLR